MASGYIGPVSPDQVIAPKQQVVVVHGAKAPTPLTAGLDISIPQGTATVGLQQDVIAGLQDVNRRLRLTQKDLISVRFPLPNLTAGTGGGEVGNILSQS